MFKFINNCINLNYAKNIDVSTDLTCPRNCIQLIQKKGRSSNYMVYLIQLLVIGQMGCCPTFSEKLTSQPTKMRESTLFLMAMWMHFGLKT